MESDADGQKNQRYGLDLGIRGTNVHSIFFTYFMSTLKNHCNGLLFGAKLPIESSIKFGLV